MINGSASKGATNFKNPKVAGNFQNLKGETNFHNETDKYLCAHILYALTRNLYIIIAFELLTHVNIT